jgi:NADPH:quinone reductase-like Zn-dependent oxidoreductase
MPHADRWDLLVRRDDFAVTELRPAPEPTLRPGEVELEVERFALTMNNVTYARLGDSILPFLDAFPAPPGYGRVPVWGFASVSRSRQPGIEAGQRYFGYLPMSTHHVVAAGPRSANGFTDTAPERAFLHSWYRTYQPAGEPSVLDDRLAVIRPLYPASFNLAEFAEQHARTGARSVVITSASSKTAVGLADLLARRGNLTTVGLTARRNLEFVEGLGRYDTVAAYDDLASVTTPLPAVFVDFTGQPDRIFAVHGHFSESLCHTALVGYTHPDAVVEPPELTRPKPEIFFTPAVEEQAIATDVLSTYRDRYRRAEDRFVADSESWFAVRRGQGPEAITAAFRSLLAGKTTPDRCDVLSPR